MRFLGSTLWTDFLLFGYAWRDQAIAAGQRGLMDFQLIHHGRLGQFKPAAMIRLHEVSLAWLKRALATPFDGRTVMVTHHLPSLNSVAARFKADLLSACFASNLDDLFGEMDLWIHGHIYAKRHIDSRQSREVECCALASAVDRSSDNEVNESRNRNQETKLRGRLQRPSPMLKKTRTRECDGVGDGNKAH